MFPPKSRKYIEFGPVRLNTVAGAFVRNVPTINFLQGPTVALTFEELMGGIVSIEDDSTFPPLIQVSLPIGSTMPKLIPATYGDSFQCTVINISTREIEFVLTDVSGGDTMKPKDFQGHCRSLPNTATVITTVVKTAAPSITVCYLISSYTTKDYVKETSSCAITGITEFVNAVPDHPNILDIYVAASNFGTWRKWCLYRWERSETWSECYPTPGMLKYVAGGTIFAEKFVMFDGLNWVATSPSVLGVTHALLPDAGTLTHAQIDEYIDQSVKTTAEPTFTNLLLTGSQTLGGQAVTKSYVDSLIAGVVPIASVISIYDNSSALPSTPTVGNRYIAHVTANGWTLNHIYEWNGSSWTHTIPAIGMVLYVEGGAYYPGLTIIYSSSNIWTKFGITMDHLDLRNRGNLPHSTIDSYLDQSVKVASGPTFAQVNLSNEASSSYNAVRLSFVQKFKTLSVAGSLHGTAVNPTKLAPVGESEAMMFYFRKDTENGLSFAFKMPRDWEERSGIFLYIHYLAETAREGEVYWRLLVMSQHETDDTERPVRRDSFVSYDFTSKVPPRELCCGRAISNELRFDTKAGEVFTAVIRRIATDGHDTAPGGIFLQDIGIFYYANHFGDDSAPSF